MPSSVAQWRCSVMVKKDKGLVRRIRKEDAADDEDDVDEEVGTAPSHPPLLFPGLRAKRFDMLRVERILGPSRETVNFIVPIIKIRIDSG